MDAILFYYFGKSAELDLSVWLAQLCRKSQIPKTDCLPLHSGTLNLDDLGSRCIFIDQFLNDKKIEAIANLPGWV